ncbi:MULTISPECIES: helix-turn-helix domain-containing protein [Bacillus subtilis group]|uniref:helix-turn-helix domain-containing protein n=1 Tax=Bacillus subtilis group TaxID=653685 RepID=UPI0004630FA3|nr:MULTISPECIES: helix-turn-helix transcriptional regulator [Bacillus subtilis group]MDR4436092.1 helix-turn-helix transcriptional regulator [Bacillus tequilensis]UYP02481.1 helix-turn-helix transcriptional regulator [Bacillus subtilis]SPT93189.1 DNA-binding protein [Bacillus tequilensis]
MFNKKLITLRKSKKLTQEEMANKIGVHRGTYANYERGHRQPDYDTLKKIADFFEVTIDYLLDQESEPIIREEKTPYIALNDPDLQIAFRDAADFSEEARRQAIDFINYLKEKEKAKGRKSPNTEND